MWISGESSGKNVPAATGLPGSFTLIEILGVMAIIATLTAGPRISPPRKKSVRIALATWSLNPHSSPIVRMWRLSVIGENVRAQLAVRTTTSNPARSEGSRDWGNGTHTGEISRRCSGATAASSA